MFKQQKGVTLVALVITIIVLLILAGVSIAMLTGDNGILTKATDSGEKTLVAEDKEAAALDLNEAYTAYTEAKYVSSTPTTSDFTTWLAANSTTYMKDTAHYTVSGTTITTVHSCKHEGDTTSKAETATIGTNGGITSAGWTVVTGD